MSTAGSGGSLPFGVAKQNLSDRVLEFLAAEGKHLIAGEWVEPASGETLDVIDPASGTRISGIARGNAADVDQAANAASRALTSSQWTGLGPTGRESLLRRLADLVEDSASDLAALETIDNGMPLWMSRDMDVSGAVDALRYMAGWPTKIAGRTVDVAGPAGREYVGFTRRVPKGVIGAIVPWNVPLMMAVWKLAPALAAGCTVVLKPAEAASLSALHFGELSRQAGFPPGVINIVTGLGTEVGEPLVRHRLVSKITFTGSTATGRAVGALAGSLSKPVSLELGGKSPTIIFDDADLTRAIAGAATSIFLNSGQTCVAGSRLYVHRTVYDQVVEGLVSHADALPVGSGFLPETMLGPVIDQAQMAKVRNYIEQARLDGSEVLTSQDVPSEGYFVAPTIVAGASQSAAITQEEVFGPVLSVYRFDGEDEVVHAANGTDYGLAAGIWTKDISRAYRMIERLECGKYSINSSGFPYPALPEGGCKGSGFGRDLGPESVDEYLHTKSVIIDVG